MKLPIVSSLAVASVILVPLMSSGIALGQTDVPSAPTSIAPQNRPIQDSTVVPEHLPSPPDSASEHSQENSVAQEESQSCPAGQFLSAFPDVLPDHWAYEAVNRLANNQPRCFPLPQS